MDMTLVIKSLIATLSESSTACVIPEAPRPAAKAERREVSPSVTRFPRPPKSPVSGFDPLFEIKPVGLGSPGKDLLGCGSPDAIAPPAEARTLESTDALDTMTDERTGTKPSGSRGLKASLFPSIGGVIVDKVVVVVAGAKVSLLPRPVEVVMGVVGANSIIPAPKFVVLSCTLSDKHDCRIVIHPTY